MGNNPFQSLFFSVALLAAMTSAQAQDQGLPPPSGPPGIQGRSAHRVQGQENEATRLGRELHRALQDEVFSLGDASVIPADKDGRSRFNKKGLRMLSVELPYTTEDLSPETRERLVQSGRGDMSVQHVTFNGQDPAASALQYATGDLVTEKRAAHRGSTTGMIVRGNRIVALEDQSRLLAHGDPRARTIARERLKKFAEVAFQFAGGANEDLQAEILVLGPDELVLTLPREFDDDLLDRGFAQPLAQELAGAKVLRGNGRVTYVVAKTPTRQDEIADDLKDASTAAAQRARVAAQIPGTQAAPESSGFTGQINPN